MKWLLCLTLFSLTTSVNTDFNFQSADNGDFSFEFDMSNIQTDRHEDPMASIDLSALDAQLESLAGNDLDSLLEELKGYHGITDDSSENPESGTPVFGGTQLDFNFDDDSKSSKYEKVIKQLEELHSVTPGKAEKQLSGSGEEKQQNSKQIAETGSNIFNGFGRTAIIDVENMFKKGKDDHPSIVELTKRAQYLKDTFHKDTDYCASNQCVHGECVSTKTGYTCSCNGGYSGERCDLDACSNSPCNNSGTCTLQGTSFLCSCTPGFTGLTCEVSTYCQSKPCVNGKCTGDDDGYSCTCYEGFTGSRCEIDACSNSPCKNSGTCTLQGTSFLCSCTRGFTGLTCEVSTYCQSKPCVNGKCTGDDDGYSCTCYEGFTGSRCEIDACSNSPCKNSGTCTLQGTSFLCSCTRGFTGLTCEVSTYCQSKPCVNGKCTGDDDGYSCTCYEGFTGSRCEIDACSNSPCKNSGTCTLQGTSFSCSCSPGFMGLTCEDVDNCPSNPCSVGECVSKPYGYMCKCPDGSEQTDCPTEADYGDVDNCQSNPCRVGECVSKPFGYLCICADGSERIDCSGETDYGDVDSCQSNPCRVGECVSKPYGYMCICADGSEQVQCDADADYVDIYSSCKDVRAMDPMSEDGEYWISPPPFNRNEVKIYCHDMANNPREYITLKAFNRGSYPMISFEGCERLRSDRSELEGSYVFSKLRVNVESMEIDTSDNTFANTYGVDRKYGSAGDCYTEHRGGELATCGTKGYFDIDTSGTGMIIDESVEWKAEGDGAIAMVTKSADFYRIRLDCGGWCGECNPNMPLVLKFKENVKEQEWEYLPASCYDLLALGKTTDDEYGVYPQILNGAKVRVYCHDMNTDSPKEYITLMKPNVGEIPNLSDETCTGTIPHAKVEEHTGKTAFSKIRVDIATMVVDETDFTFSTSSGNLVAANRPIPFGHAMDSFTKHFNNVKSSCGPMGTFKIDLRGTGLKVNDNLAWVSGGEFSYVKWTRDDDNATVLIRGGGYPGWSKPIELITLVPNRNDAYYYR